MDFGSRLKLYRQQRNLTQAELAKITGFARTTISELESGNKKVTLNAIKKLAKATGTKISDWLDADDTINIKLFEGLKTVMDTLIEVGEIDREGNCSPKAERLLMKMLKEEVKKYVKR